MLSNSNASKDAKKMDDQSYDGVGSCSPNDELKISKKARDDFSGGEREHREAPYVGRSNNDERTCGDNVNSTNRHRDLPNPRNRAASAGGNSEENGEIVQEDPLCGDNEERSVRDRSSDNDYSCVDTEVSGESDHGTLANVTQTDSTANEPGPGNARASGASVQGEDSSDDARVGAYRFTPANRSVELMRSDAPGLARKREGRHALPGIRTAFADDEDDATHHENDQPSTSGDEDAAISTTAYCVETGEHVEVRQTPIASAYRINEGANPDTQGDSAEDEVNLNQQHNRIIPSAPNFVIKREGPTKDIVNSLLRFSGSDGDATNESSKSAATVVAGMGGLGKSVLAAAAVRDPAVSEYFSSGVTWLSLGPKKLTSVGYRNSLLNLCSQVSLEGDSSRDVAAALSGFPFGIEESEQVTKEEFKRLKAIVKPLLGGKKIVIVLDDVWQKSDIELFVFGEECHMLVTSRKPDIADSSPSLEVSVINLCLPNEEESLELLENVIGEPLTEFETCSNADAREIVRRCHFLPLAIVSLGLLMKGCENFNPIQASEILESLHPAGGGDIDQVNVHSSCYHVFDQSFKSFGGDNGRVGAFLRLFFAAFCACFTNSTGGRVSIPEVVVRTFFNDLLVGRGGYFTIDEQSILQQHGINSRNIIERLRSIGFLDRLDHLSEGHDGAPQTHIVVHHDLQKEYGVKAAVIFEELQKKAIFGRWLWRKSKDHSTFEQAQARANAVVVKNFERRAVQKDRMCFSNGWEWSNVEGDDQEYMLENLSAHMVNAMQHQKALNLTQDLSYVSRRIEYFGITKCNILGLQDFHFIGLAIVEKKCSPLFWIKGESIYEEAVARKFIGDAQKGKDALDQLYREIMALKIQWFLNGPWVINFTMASSSSPLYVIFRRVRSRHYKRMSSLFNEAGVRDHPFAIGFYGTYLHWKGDLEDSVEVLHRVLTSTKEMFPGESMLEANCHLDLILAYLAKGSYKESISHSEGFLSAVKSEFGTKDSVELATAIAILGLSQWFDGQLEESRASFQGAHDMYVRTGCQGEGLEFVQKKLNSHLK